MKLFIYTLLLALLAAFVMAAAPHKSVIISYPDGTPDSVIAEAIKAIKAAGGVITHEYKIIKGFAANAPAKALETVQIMGDKYNAIIEEDQIVTTQNGIGI
ncbi:hypothetical protein K402DRAFT_389623 [Aulographum hederae CBS 113979]|uniref:Inhibitor I9 domain-containing protein n=1 Tax=Aulographum hederae CBS 113979 TaxID=1176131 RepID=A0A6G1HBT6_9PEZI|nr:hypothetical protein K402DRAFT_389623 [Aulographum hederae CBS 113979]